MHFLSGRRTLLVIALAIFFVTYLGFAITRNVACIGMLFALYGFHQGIFRSVGKALASDFVPESIHAGECGCALSSPFLSIMRE